MKPYGKYCEFVQGRFEWITITDFILQYFIITGAALRGENNISAFWNNKIHGKNNCIHKNLTILVP